MAGRAQQIHYYRPYDSADESGFDSDTASTDSWFSDGADQASPPTGQVRGHPDFRAFATQNQLMDAAGRNFSTIKDQLAYGIDKLGKYTVYSQYDAPPPDLSGEAFYGRTKFATQDGNVTSLVMVDSRYRDRQAYPQPTFFTLRLPRIYKNVTNITLSDVKLLTSFYFFRLSKGNTDITIYEKDRTTLTYEGTLQSTIVKRFITTGSYNIDGLQNELQQQLNYTPLFFDYPNGFSDFIGPFRASGDYSINFNQPGDYFYNNTTNLNIANPTMDTIVNYYWGQRYAGLTTYSVDQVLLAYYYPVLKEYLFDEAYSSETLNLDVGIGINPLVTTTDDVINYLLYSFQGIYPTPDPIALAVVNANIPELDKYRLNHTFRYYLINKYIVGRDTRSQNVYITSPSLNTSLVNLLNQQRDRYFARALQLCNLTAKQYAAITQSIDRTLAVLQSMYSYEQTRFLDYFAVPWSFYTLSYYADLDNSFLLRNGNNAVGIPANDAQAVQAGIVPQSNDVLLSQQVNPPYYWPNLTSTNVSTIYMENLSTTTSSFNYLYNMNTQQFEETRILIDEPDYYINTDLLTQTANVVCPIQSGKYTIFKFRSPVRQTMQVETLPRPTLYRIPTYNLSNFGSTINQYYDLSYVFFFTSNNPYTPNSSNFTIAYDNIPTSNLFQIPGWTETTASSNDPNYSYGRSYQSSLALYGSNLLLDVLTYKRSLFAQFTTPEYIQTSPTSSFTYSLNVSVQFYDNPTDPSTLRAPGTNFRMFLYHDRGAFQGDVLCNRSENPKFYKQSTFIAATSTIGTISFTAYPQQTYFLSLRADDTNFGNVYPRLVPWFSSTILSTQQTLSIDGINPATDIYSSNFNTLIQTNFNYAQVYDSNWIQLPIQSTLWAPDPSEDPANAFISISNVPIGYDQSNVSTDYTDYIPYVTNAFESFVPSCNFGIDPITQYFFQSNSAYNSTTKTYFYANSSNSIFTPGITQVYSPGIVDYRQYKLCHYYTPNYIPEPDTNQPLASNLIGNISTAQLPFTISTTLSTPIPGYTYGTNCNLQLGRGVLGFSIIPDEGVWDLKRIVFRSAIEDYANDPNQSIYYLGIYNLGDIIYSGTDNLSLSNAICVLSNTARVTYTSSINLSNAGYDIKGGSYYEFTKDTSFVPQGYSTLLGYTQSVPSMSDQPQSMYMCIAFTSNGLTTTIKALSGSAIPYPYYNNLFVSTAYLDGTRSYVQTDGVIFPSTIGPDSWPFVSSISSVFGPPPGIDATQSQYALSMPIGTSVLAYKGILQPVFDSSFFRPWSTTLTPTNVYANVSNFVMLQDTNFNIFNYALDQQDRTFCNATWTLSPDTIFPAYENTSLVAAAANSEWYYFLGFSNNSTSFSLRLKRFNPTMGILYDYPLDNSFQVPYDGSVRGFLINNSEQMTLAYEETASTKLYYNLLASTSMTSKIVPAQSTATIAMDVHTSTLYWIPIVKGSNYGSSLYSWSIDDTAGFPGTNWTFTGTLLPSNFTGVAVNYGPEVPEGNDRLFLFSQQAGYEGKVYYSSGWNFPGPGQIQLSQVSSIITTQPIQNITNGYNASVWLTATDQPIVWGNRNSTADLNGAVNGSWQIFYPFQKVILEKLANSYNSITDLTNINYPEYPHTAMFYYRDEAAYNLDTKHKWGLESKSNFYVADPNMSGYYFNSYIFNVPVEKSLTSNDYQYLTIRGYSPTETSETLLRFQLPNLYDFGYATQNNIIDEIGLYGSNPSLFNPTYGQTLINFNNAFIQSNSAFGQGLLPNFDGSNFDTSNFAGFAYNVSTLYNSYQANAALVSSINDYVQTNLTTYISTNLAYILPPNAFGRENYTAPILFSILWKSGLLPQYKDLLEDWGLGYNLGYAKIDTPFSTYHRASSFYKILEDYIFLRLNPQYQMNRMDNTYKENFKITRDPTGQIQNFHGKLLLNNFNTFSQTFIFNNQPFNPPVGRLDQLYFQWVNIVGDQIDNNDCEWSATMVITENKSTATTGSSIPALPPMPPLR